MTFLVRIDLVTPEHVHVSLFAGGVPGSRGKVGDLVFRVPEWRAFRAIVEKSKSVSVDDAVSRLTGGDAA